MNKKEVWAESEGALLEKENLLWWRSKRIMQKWNMSNTNYLWASIFNCVFFKFPLKTTWGCAYGSITYICIRVLSVNNMTIVYILSGQVQCNQGPKPTSKCMTTHEVQNIIFWYKQTVFFVMREQVPKCNCFVGLVYTLFTL